MWRRLPILLAFATLSVGPAFADMGPIIPGTKHVHPFYRIITNESFPDHAFILMRHGIQFDPKKGVWDQFSESDYGGTDGGFGMNR